MMRAVRVTVYAVVRGVRNIFIPVIRLLEQDVMEEVIHRQHKPIAETGQ